MPVGLMRWVRADGCGSWIYTGDEVVINEQKDVFVVDRIKVSANKLCRAGTVY